MPSCADCLKIWEPQSAGTLRACPGITLLLPLHRHNVFPKTVLGIICGCKREGSTEVWVKLHNNKLQDLHSFSNIISMIKPRRIKSVGVARMGKEINLYKVFTGKHNDKRPVG